MWYGVGLCTFRRVNNSKLPILFTSPGISTFERYAAIATSTNNLPSPDPATSTASNMSQQQWQKLHLHEKCNHEGFTNLNRWICAGYFPGVPPELSSIPDPTCLACAFGKARHRTHKSHTGHISSSHNWPGARVSSDGMKAGIPGRPVTTQGSPSTLHLKYVSFWVDHYSHYVYATFHPTKAAHEHQFQTRIWTLFC